MGIIGMKVYLRGFAAKLPDVTTMAPFYRYALSHPITTSVIGCDTIKQLEENVNIAKLFSPMTEDEKRSLEASVSPYARELMYYKP
jgi:hypothetical protein